MNECEYFRKSIDLMSAGDADAAEFLLLQSLEIEETELKYTCLGWLHGNLQGRTMPAVRAFVKALRMNREYGDAYNECGALLLRVGRDRRAIQCFTRALKAQTCSKRHFALYNLALIYAEKNRPERSRRYLNLALKLKPDFQEAREFLDDLAADKSGRGY